MTLSDLVIPDGCDRGDRAPESEKGSASKMDVGKAPIWRGFVAYFPRAMWAVAFVSEYGNRKYGEWGGWRKVPNAIPRYLDADLRHLLKTCTEGDYDDSDSGLAHLAQKAWSAMAELEQAITEGHLEVRIGNDIVDGKPVLGTAKKVAL
jgi:hypothetical protein